MDYRFAVDTGDLNAGVSSNSGLTQTMDSVDIIINGGRIIDPSTGLDGVGTIGVRDGRISVIDMDSSKVHDAARVVRADGCIVIPGMIDLHVHGYEFATPLGVNLDEHCLARAVTTVVDAGSAGACTLPGLRKFIAERSNTRLLCFLHIASHGLAAAGCCAGAPGGECDHLNQVNVDECVDTARNNPDIVVGVKVRLSTSCTDNGRVEEEVYRRALAAATKCGLPLMVHHTESTVPVGEEAGKLSCPLNMNPGDVYTHAFHPYKSHILHQNTRGVHPDVWAAKKKGIYFDVGHGAGSFSWTMAEAAMKEGFWPDVISTDLHKLSSEGPAYDLPTVMTKMFAIGMPLNDVIAAVTSTPAKVIKRSDTVGSLQIGREADISILKLEDCSIELEDCHGQIRHVTKQFVPVSVLRKGIQYEVMAHPNCPNSESIKAGIEAKYRIEIHD